MNDISRSKRSQFQFVTHEVRPQAQMGKTRRIFKRRSQMSQWNHDWFTDGKKEQQEDALSVKRSEQ